MGVIVNKKEDQDKLTQRINADLRAKSIDTTQIAGNEDPDLIEDSDYVKDMKKTGKFGWIWIVLIVLALLALIPIFIL